MSRAELRELIRHENAEQVAPLPVCKQCRLPFFGEEADWFFPRQCASCGMARLERMLQRIARRRGRAWLKALIRLAM